jgi:hypothetical protein
MQTELELAYEAVRVLYDDITYLESQLADLDPDSITAESKERVLNVKWRLWSEQRDKIERLLDSQAKEAAQDRWKWHESNDTLDLY